MMFDKIEEKVRAGVRLTPEEGLYLYQEAPMDRLGPLANEVREQRHGNRTSYIINMHLNYSNVCAVKCMFCAFRRDKGEEGAYEMSMEEMIHRVSPLKDVPGCRGSHRGWSPSGLPLFLLSYFAVNLERELPQGTFESVHRR